MLKALSRLSVDREREMINPMATYASMQRRMTTRFLIDQDMVYAHARRPISELLIHKNEDRIILSDRRLLIVGILFFSFLIYYHLLWPLIWYSLLGYFIRWRYKAFKKLRGESEDPGQAARLRLIKERIMTDDWDSPPEFFDYLFKIPLLGEEEDK